MDRNTYPDIPPLSANALIMGEFAAMGFEARQSGIFVSADIDGTEVLCLETVTSFTSALARKICSQKVMFKRFMREAGISVPLGRVFTESQKDDALSKLQKIAPAVLKPADGKKGRGVSVGVTEDEFEDAWSSALENSPSRRVIVESYFSGGEEARYFVVDGVCIAVCGRIPPTVLGDGQRTLQQLVDERNEYRSTHPHLHNRLIHIDLHRTALLRAQGLDLDSVVPAGKEIVIDMKAGYSTGADSINITSSVHPSMKEIAEKAVGTIPGLDVAGVDILAYDHASPMTDDNYVIVEVNTMPGVGGHHYPVYGTPINVTRHVVEACVRKVRAAAPPKGLTEIIGNWLARFTPATSTRSGRAQGPSRRPRRSGTGSR